MANMKSVTYVFQKLLGNFKEKLSFRVHVASMCPVRYKHGGSMAGQNDSRVKTTHT